MSDFQINSFKEYQEEYNKSIVNPEQFWENIAEDFIWKSKWDKVLEWNFSEPKIKWFKNAKFNITENIFERNLPEKANEIAYHWEPNNPVDKQKSYTYNELFIEVQKCANLLKSYGVKKGDRVGLYMPMIIELPIAVLACARIGAIHSVVFAGFSANALADRLNDAEAVFLFTSNELFRGAKSMDVKSLVDEALKNCPTVKNVAVVEISEKTYNKVPNRDFSYQKELAKQSVICPAEIMDAEDPLFILYTSGSTGKPKGVVHSCGGYMVYTAYTFSNVFQYKKGDIYWCTADIGWITGHSYIIYGPLLCGASSVLFEGIPTFPHNGRFWEVIDKYKVNQFYTAPTAIRALMACDDTLSKNPSLKSLKVLGTVGEPINEEAWQWYFKNIGKANCPIVDTWWQTETGGIMISGLGNLSPQKPTFAGYPLPGIQAVLLDQEGNEINENDQEGYLCVKFPWPGMLRTTYGDHERCRHTYFSNYKNYYFTGDGAKRDENGMFRIIGRVDDVINVSGHRFGTAEIENAINKAENVIESAVVGYPHPIKGQSIYAFVKLDSSENELEIERSYILDCVVNEIGKIAVPEKIQFVDDLPKTRSGKIMRRILRKIAESDSDNQQENNFGDTSTLIDPSVVDKLIAGKL